MKSGSRPRKPASCKSFMMPYFHVVSYAFSKSKKMAVTCCFWVKQSVSQWNAWPATSRSALQDLRSCAILQTSLTLSPVSSSICCTHIRQGHPRWRFHSGLMSGLPPARVSTAKRSAEWAGVTSGSRCTWPKMESRLRQIRIAKPSSPVWLVTEAFVTKWNQRIPKIRRWQFMRNASNRRSSAFKRVHISEPYNSTEMTRVS